MCHPVVCGSVIAGVKKKTVIHFRTQAPAFTTNHEGHDQFGLSTPARCKVDGALSFGSAANHIGQSLRTEYSAANFASLTLLSTTFTSHLRAGAQMPKRYPTFGLRPTYVSRIDGTDQIIPNPAATKQIGTAYNQFNLLQKFRFRLQDKVELAVNFQYSTTSDIPRYDALTEMRNGQLRWARWDYGPQTRALVSLKLVDRRATALYDLATYHLSHQIVAEDRLRRRFQDSLEENNLVDVGTTNLQTDFVKSLAALELRYGFDLRHDAVNSTAFLRSVATEQIAPTPVPSRYPSQGSSLSSGGLYAEGSYQLKPAWQLRGGLRYSYQRLRARFGPQDPIAWPNVYLEGINNNEGALTGALGLKHRTGPKGNWSLLIAQGFRAPNIDDFAKFRENDGFVQVPNPNLKPERSLT
ncbi:MAG: TonB-dependent receptor, partial [Bacteroidota bacterium]